MTIQKKYFDDVLSENEIRYFMHLEGMLESIDELANVEIIKTINAYKFRIAPSIALYRDVLFDRIIELHKMLHIKLNISKSIKSSGTIYFDITI